jgi:hypothetical protein
VVGNIFSTTKILSLAYITPTPSGLDEYISTSQSDVMVGELADWVTNKHMVNPFV